MTHFVYKTTNLVNNKYYIGVHSTDDLDDGYLGSGTRLKSAVSKYGIESFSREILEYFDTKREAFVLEATIVTQELIESDELCMNMKPGGSGGYNNDEHMRKCVAASVARTKHLWDTDPVWARNRSAMISLMVKNSFLDDNRLKDIERLRVDIQPLAVEAARSPEANAKRKATQQKIKHQRGTKNSQFGTAWVSNNVHTVKISIELLHEYESKGYVRGRKLVT